MIVLGRGGAKTRSLVLAPLVEEFHRRDWVLRAPDNPLHFIISDAGEGWLRRGLADETPFAAQHRLQSRREIEDAGGLTQSVLVNDGESPLAWLFRRRGPDGKPLISETQFQAGERLRTDFTLTQISPRMGVDLEAPVVAGRRGAKSAELPEIVLAAKQRFARAIAAVGPGLSDIAVDVCCYLTGLEAAERRKSWPQRSAKIVLQLALDRLAAHYGMGPVRGTGAKMRAWTAPEEEAQ